MRNTISIEEEDEDAVVIVHRSPGPELGQLARIPVSPWRLRTPMWLVECAAWHRFTPAEARLAIAFSIYRTGFPFLLLCVRGPLRLINLKPELTVPL